MINSLRLRDKWVASSFLVISIAAKAKSLSRSSDLVHRKYGFNRFCVDNVRPDMTEVTGNVANNRKRVFIGHLKNEVTESRICATTIYECKIISIVTWKTLSVVSFYLQNSIVFMHSL